MTGRERLSATVEKELLEAGRAAVAAGRAPSLSAWVNDALRRQAENDARLEAFDEYMADYEAEHGNITEAEMEAAEDAMRRRAVVVRGTPGAA